MMATLFASLAKQGWDAIYANRDSRGPVLRDGAVNDKVVSLRPTSLDIPESVEPSSAGPTGRGAPLALQDDPALVELRERNYYDIGYADGTCAPNHEAQRYGCERVGGHFCSGIGRAIGARVALLDQHNLKLLDVGMQGSALTRERLRTQMIAVERDIDTLKRQAELAEEGAGWLQPMLADYRAGFERALREAVDSVYQRR